MDANTLTFWIIAGAAASGSAALLLRPLLRGDAGAVPAPDIEVYRDQLAEIDRDLARQVISRTEAETLRIEIKRRLLAVADKATAPSAKGAILPAAAVTVVALAAGLGLYGLVGHPALPDRPLALRIAEADAAHANRPSQAEAEAFIAANAPAAPSQEIDPENLALLDRLQDILAEKPDLTGARMLAGYRAQLQQWPQARAAQAEVLRLAGDAATGEDYVALAEYMILGVNGYVSPEAEDALRNAMQRSPRDPRARYYSGLLAAQAGRPDLTWDLWTRLVDEGPADAPWVDAIRNQLPDIAAALGRDMPGPTADDIDAAQDMAPEDRAAMIEGMVDRLADRLSREGGPAQDWARLIRARAVQGDTDQAMAVWAEAQATFAGDAEGLALIDATARDVGLAE